MYPVMNEQMTKQHMDALEHEAAIAWRKNLATIDLDNNTGSNSLTRILYYVLFGMRLPSPNQKQAEMYHTIRRLQSNLNIISRVVGLIALGLGLLLGSFLYSQFGLLPIVLLASIILVIVSFPMLMRLATLLSKHNHVHSHG